MPRGLNWWSDAATIAVVFTPLGAIGFVLGSLLMLPETLRPG